VRSQELILRELNEYVDSHEFTVHAAHIILGIAYPTVLRHCSNGYIRHITRGKRKSILCEELKRYVKEGNFKPDAPGTMVEEPVQESIADLIRPEEGGGINIDQLSQEQRAQLSSNPFKEH
jgi:hypothetical protein